MSPPLILAIDQGTTNTKAVLVEPSGRILARASAPARSSYPRPDWAEQSAGEIWESLRKVVAEILASGAPAPQGIAIANQRETLILWDSETGAPIAPAMLWQCRRAARDCEALRRSGADPLVTEASGLPINALFPAAKLGWAMRNLPEAAALAAAGRLRAGTVDSWLLYKLTGGAEFATDHSNASRTQLFHTGKLAWDEALCGLFGAPLSALPEPRPSDSLFGHTAEGATALPGGLPILAMMGDSHAALYGHGVRKPGFVKATYGTGSSLMTLTPGRVVSRSGLAGALAWSDRDGVAYGLEGNISVSAQGAAFVAETLGLPDVAALSALAQTAPESGGVVFVPALAGLGAPYWDEAASGAITGLTLATRPAQIARAAFEAVALQIAAVFRAMEAEAGTPLEALLADGGASTNDFLMGLQAEILGRPVLRREAAEIGALGVAAMAFRALGLEGACAPREDRRFEPGAMAAETRLGLLKGWDRAVAQVRRGGADEAAAS